MEVSKRIPIFVTENKNNMKDYSTIDPFLLEEDIGCLTAADEPCRDLKELLLDLHEASGAHFVSLLKEITAHRAFCPLKNAPNIYITGGETGEDYDNLLNAAHKAVDQGYRVFILPNPKSIRTADFVFERKGVYKMFDLKTISGKRSVSSRLLESIGQKNHVVLNMATTYDSRLLAKDIKLYFEANKGAKEVLIIKDAKFLSVSRQFVEGKDYIKMFMKRYLK